MTYTTKSWGNDPTGGTPLNAIGLDDLESRIEFGIDGSGPGTLGLVYAYDYGVRADGVTPSAAALQAACNAAKLAGAGTVLLPSGSSRIMMETSVFVPDSIRICGTSRRGSELKAINGTFPTSTPMFYLGSNIVSDTAFDCRLENLGIDMDNISGSTCVYSRNIQEGGGLEHVGLYGFMNYGAWFDTAGCQNFACRDLEVYGGTGSLIGVYFLGVGSTITLEWATLRTNNTTTGIGVKVEGASAINLKQIHSEACQYGIYVSGQCTVVGAWGSPDVDNLVYLDGSTDHTSVSNATAGGSLNQIVDVLHGLTITGASAPVIDVYHQGNLRVGATEIFPGASFGAPPSGFGTPGNVIFNTGPAAQPGWICYSAGSWRAFAMSPTVTDLAYSASMSPQAHVAVCQRITVTNATAMTINAPSNPNTGQDLVFDIINSSGGAMGAITWNAIFKMAGAFTNPATGKRRTIRFYFDGTSWIETGRAAADI